MEFADVVPDFVEEVELEDDGGDVLNENDNEEEQEQEDTPGVVRRKRRQKSQRFVSLDDVGAGFTWFTSVACEGR